MINREDARYISACTEIATIMYSHKINPFTDLFVFEAFVSAVSYAAHVHHISLEDYLALVTDYYNGLKDDYTHLNRAEKREETCTRKPVPSTGGPATVK